MVYLLLGSFLFIILLLSYKLNKLTDIDNDFIPDELEDLAEEIKKEFIERSEAVEKELSDVKEALKNVKKQSGDVFEAAAGAKRKGRKKNSK
jgi:t-SNARE complex subunit (syntaxin)|tara:strand:- start:595 stop:870 length:276 start_codon:yes stop_codon:yes gene_type:complete